MTETQEVRLRDGAQRVLNELTAAQYLRMSTEHQKYSAENQSATISAYAVLHKLAVVRTYVDRGKSGLSLEGRSALRQLIADVESGAADFKVVLVYDISRWGRFQDSDESAYYEYLCRRAGISVHYCAEQFQNDGSPLSTVIKGLKRAMAGEYSRELSHKVFAGQLRVLEAGYSTGGLAPYGLQRVLHDHAGAFKAVLKRGERKCLQSDRVAFTLGPPEQVETVRWIFQQFANERWTEQSIAKALNGRGIKTLTGKAWKAITVRKILTNEKYAGSYIWNRSSAKLKSTRTANDTAQWARKTNAFPAIVTSSLYDAAQARYRERAERYSAGFMLDAIRATSRIHGRVTADLLREIPGCPSQYTIARRFGSFAAALTAAGVKPVRMSGFVEVSRRLKAERSRILTELTDGLEALGAQVERSLDSLTVDHMFSLTVAISAVIRLKGHRLSWRLPAASSKGDFLLFLQMDRANAAVAGYYLLPLVKCFSWPPYLSHANCFAIEPFRVEGVRAAIALAGRVPLDNV